MAVTATSVADTCLAAKRAATQLASLPSGVKNAALEAIAAALIERTPEILEANARDLEAGREAGLTDALMDRLALDPGRVAVIARQVREIAALPDPVGEVIEGRRLANGLEVRKVRVPLGVIAVVYEARPNVTIDAAALCLKSGNAIVLRGSSMAAHSNAVLAAVAIEAARSAGLPEGAMSLVAGGGHEELAELATQTGVIDLIIPRGGEGLKSALKGVATVPVMYAASGNCHVYVDATASLPDALAITLNAKVQRPSVCNAAETLLVHEAVADEFLPMALGCAGGGRGRAAWRFADAGVRRGRAGGGGHGRGLGHRVPRPDAGREGGRLGGGGDRAHQPLGVRALRGDRHPRHRGRARVPDWALTRRACTSTRPPGSPTAGSSGWVPRSATRLRSSTPVGRSGCGSCAPSST